MKADMHMHSTYSDGSDDLSVLLNHVREAGIDTFALTDHDTILGAVKMDQMVPDDMTFYRGIEFSAITPYREAHILGYDYDPQNALLLKTIEEGKRLRRDKLDHRLSYLKENFNIVFKQEDLDYLYSLNAAAKPHLGRMLMKYGYADSITEAIDRYIKGCPADHDRIDYREAIKAIRAAGGIAVWAHPLGGEHMRHFEKWELERQLGLLLSAGIQGLECYYSRYSIAEIHELLDEAQAQSLLISGGSDYHGRNKNIALATLSAEPLDIHKSDLTLLDALKNHKNH